MKRQKIGTFNNLKNGDLIISPIDNEVTQYYIDKDGIKYLSSKNSLFGIFQFQVVSNTNHFIIILIAFYSQLLSRLSFAEWQSD